MDVIPSLKSYLKRKVRVTRGELEYRGDGVNDNGIATSEEDENYRNWASDIGVKTKIQNIELSSNWIDIELAKAGTLGVEVLYKVDVLNDVELLKVTGNLNSDDWTAIKNMKNMIIRTSLPMTILRK